MDYQTKRGGIVKMSGVPQITLELASNDAIRTDRSDLRYVRAAFVKALSLEKQVNASLLALHEMGSEAKDPPFTDFLEGEFLNEQVEANYELAKIISQLDMIGNNGYGIWHFAQRLGDKI